MAIHLIQSFLDPYQEFRSMEMRRPALQKAAVNEQQPMTSSVPENDLHEIDASGKAVLETKNEADPESKNRSNRGPVNLEELSQSMNTERNPFEENNVSVTSLDMEQAISDMKKDGILSQYQVFVGSIKNQETDDTQN
ncbi:MAG: hypothetical protein PHP50_10210 [Lachnospiraceae bacterium]|nr:hypothetical protein [Lachnospiraceae bacterium]